MSAYRMPQANRLDSELVDDDESGKILEYFQVCYRNKGKIIAATFIGFFLAVVISLLQTPIYKGHTSLEIQAHNEKALGDQGLSTNEALSDVQTQAQLLQSGSLLERVLDKLEPKPPSTPAQPAKQTEPQPQPPTKRVQPPAWRRILSQIKLPRALPPQEEAISMAVKTLEVTPPKEARIIDIESSSTDPDFVALFLNTLTEEYVRQRLEDRWKLYQQTGDWLSQAHEDLRGKLQKSEERLQAYARSAGLLFTSDTQTQSVAEDKLKQLQEELSRAQADRISKESNYKIAASSPADALPDPLVSGSYRDFQSRLTELRRQQVELTSTLTPAHYKVKRVQAQISELESALTRERANIIQRVRNDYQSALGREKMLSENYSAQTAVVASESEKMIQFKMLKQEVDSNRQIYEASMQKGKEASLESAMQASNVRIVDPALPPLLPAKPNILLNSALGLFLGTMLGMAFVLGRHIFNQSIRVPGNAPYFLNVPELGVIPSSKVERRGRFAGGLQWLLSSGNKTGRESSRPVNKGPLLEMSAADGCVELMTWQQKPSLLAESFRSTIASILSPRQDGNSPRTIVVTSSTPAEGKTTVTCNLGIALAEINRKVLLIDADLRKPRLHRILSRANTWGLSNLLREGTSIQDYPSESLVRKTDIPGLCLLSSGPGAENISNLLYSPRFSQLLDRLEREFDVVLIDTPPMLQLSDARVISRHADAAILVIRAGVTHQDAALAAVQRFQEDGTPILGTILNDWDPNTVNSGYRYDYTYHYGEGKRA